MPRRRGGDRGRREPEGGVPGATRREGGEGVGSRTLSRQCVRPGEGQRPRTGKPRGEPRGAAVAMAPGGEGVTRAQPRVPRGSGLQMVPSLPREPAACGRGKLLSSFRGAAVPPLAPARRHAPPAPRDSARPPPAVRPAASGPPAAATRHRPSRPGCGRGDDPCAPARRAPAGGAGARLRSEVGAGARPALSGPTGRRALCSRVRTAGLGSGSGSRPTRGAGEGGCDSCL